MEKITYYKDQENNIIINYYNKKRVLKKPIKIILYILLITFYLSLLLYLNNDINRRFEKCDLEKGYTCTIYDLTHNRK